MIFGEFFFFPPRPNLHDFTLPYSGFFSIAHSERGPFFYWKQVKVILSFLEIARARLQILAGFLDMTLTYVSATPLGQSIPQWMELSIKTSFGGCFPPGKKFEPFLSLGQKHPFPPLVPALACADSPLVACTTLPIHSSLLY